jgi:hypothetical protein
MQLTGLIRPRGAGNGDAVNGWTGCLIVITHRLPLTRFAQQPINLYAITLSCAVDCCSRFVERTSGSLELTAARHCHADPHPGAGRPAASVGFFAGYVLPR